MNIVDLRSDTVTKPTPAMWEAMAHAEVGDDVYGEDPTVNRLEAMAAERMGKEAAVFVVSGTMGNLTALLTHCGRGDEVILGDKSHTFLYEQGGMAALGGIMPHTVPNQMEGTLCLSDVRAAIRTDDEHFPRTRLICLENTNNVCNGAPLTPWYMARMGELAREHGLKIHVDGARIFNAAAALGVEARELVQDADSVTFCLSKGLCAPVGSVLCGSAEFIKQARRSRKIIGGGMRQAGVIAAAGIVALEQMTGRLVEDHARAKRLAEGLAELPGVVVEPVFTNILYFSLAPQVTLSAEEVAARLREDGILIGPHSARSFRAVTHYWIDDEGIERTLQAFRETL
ncbi:MAG TPA: low-specificity L-threonine aldolase [Anaerolineae bacterium]|nr:low-specificity L-threonine aldolase [Anaerolineae bacterium]HQH38095.1 low-specificity L-threonine aldolase [Anaerolineae bacterium]